MINGISSSSVYQQQYTPRANSNYTLTDDQKKTANSIISNYDPENMTSDSMKSMFDELKSSGIQMGDDLKEILDTAGFQPPEKPQGPPPDGNPSANQTNSDLSDQIVDILKKIKSGEISTDEIDSFINNLQESGQLTQGSLINKTA